jgi:hypothetical protein
LFVGDLPEKQFIKSAQDQTTVLVGFEEEGWPAAIDDPLPFRPNGNRRARLRDTVRSLNRRLITGRIRFFTARQCTAVRWEIVDQESSGK